MKDKINYPTNKASAQQRKQPAVWEDSSGNGRRQSQIRYLMNGYYHKFIGNEWNYLARKLKEGNMSVRLFFKDSDTCSHKVCGKNI